VDDESIYQDVSVPIPVEDFGERYMWLRVRNRISNTYSHMIVSASVSLEKPTVEITLRDASHMPPYRVENRSSSVTIVYRQVRRRQVDLRHHLQQRSQAGRQSKWRVLPPFSWHAFVWENVDGKREICVGARGFEEQFKQVSRLLGGMYCFNGHAFSAAFI
jgi:hypothetical protein